MFGLTKLMHTVDPHTTVEKIIFLIQFTWTHANRLTTAISFGTLFVLITLRSIKNSFKRYTFVYRLPEVLIVVIVSTSEFWQLGIRPILDPDATPVISAHYKWHEKGVDVLGDVAIATGDSFFVFPFNRDVLKYAHRTTSTAVQVYL